MKLSKAFFLFAACCLDASRDRTWTRREILTFAIGNLRTDQEKIDALQSIEVILSSDLDNEALNRLWQSTNSRVRYDNDYRRFLALARDMLKEAVG